MLIVLMNVTGLKKKKSYLSLKIYLNLATAYFIRILNNSKTE